MKVFTGAPDNDSNNNAIRSFIGADIIKADNLSEFIEKLRKDKTTDKLNAPARIWVGSMNVPIEMEILFIVEGRAVMIKQVRAIIPRAGGDEWYVRHVKHMAQLTYMPILQ